jgi:3-oxoacyl-[acyl-carrier protein] reductase
MRALSKSISVLGMRPKPACPTGAETSLQDVIEGEFRRQFDTNVLGLLLTSKRAAQKSGEKGGCIINIGSVASTLTLPASLTYAATKSAVDGIPRVLAKEHRARNIRVDSINPGGIDTEGARAMGTYEQVATAIKAITRLGRAGMPEDIGLFAALLASDEALAYKRNYLWE